METTWTVLRTIVAVVGSIGILGGILASLAGFAYLLFKRFATSWLDQRFKKDFADYTHRHNQEIETMKARFAETLDRTTNLHSKEFEILPTAWGLLTTAISQVQDGLTVYFEPQIIHEMEERHVRTMMMAADYSEEDIAIVLAAQGNNRDLAYHDARIRKISGIGMDGYAAFTNYYLSKAILIDPTLRQLLIEMSAVMARAVNHDFTEIQKYPSIPAYMAAKQEIYVAEVQPLRDRIQNRMFARLTATQDPEITALPAA